MSKNLLHRRMMMQAGGGDGWTYGKRYANMGSTDTTIIDDPNYALSPYYPFTGTRIFFGDNLQDVSILRQFNNDICNDYWTAKSNKFRLINFVEAVDSLRICAYIPNMQNMALANFPASDYTSAYFLYKGDLVPPLYNSDYNDILNYYGYTTNKIYQVGVDLCTTYKFIPIDTTEANYNQIYIYSPTMPASISGIPARIFEFDSNFAYKDYWGFNSNQARAINLNTQSRYLLISTFQSIVDNVYLSYRSSGHYIWKGKNV